MSILLLALAFAASPMTGTRGEASVGFTDLLLALAAVATFADVFASRAVKNEGMDMARIAIAMDRAAIRKILVFLLVAFFLVTVSSIANWRQVSFYNSSAVIVLASYLVSFVMIWALYLQVLQGKLLDFLRWFHIISFGIVVAYLSGIAIGFQAFYSEYRFVGLSENPNQAALQMLAVMVMSLMSMAKVNKFGPKLSRLVGLNFVGATVVGTLTASDSFFVGAAILYAGLIAYFALLALRSSPMIAGAAIFFGLPAVAIIFVLVAQQFEVLYTIVAERGAYRDQDLDRYYLWLHGIQAWTESPIIGNGIGGWSGLTQPFQGREAHNSIIDWATLTGSLGLMAYFALNLAFWPRSFPRYSLSYSCLLAVFLFASFHFTFRQPVFWLCMALIFMRSRFVDARGREAEQLL